MFGYLRLFLTVALLAGIGAGVVHWGIHMIGTTPLILAAILAILLNPLVIALERRGLGRTPAALLVVVLLLLLLGTALFLLMPVIAREFRAGAALLQNETPATLVEKLRRRNRDAAPAE